MCAGIARWKLGSGMMICVLYGVGMYRLCGGGGSLFAGMLNFGCEIEIQNDCFGVG